MKVDTDKLAFYFFMGTLGLAMLLGLIILIISAF